MHPAPVIRLTSRRRRGGSWGHRSCDLRADLGTPTVVPPVWFYRAHPDALPVTA
ncbi:beta-galactosidase, partial [Streptomyces hirsutus]